MPVSRTGRVHLIYQFIILTMLVMFIGYDELLSERKYVYLSIICIFMLAMVILSCYTELLPVQKWISQYSSSTESTESNEESFKKGSTDSEHPNPAIQEKRTHQIEKSDSSSKPRVYRFRNWKKDGSIEKQSVKTSSSTFDAANIMPMEEIGDYNFGSYPSKESDLTKRYYFPFRQKRLEEWVDSKESRPYKIRPWEKNSQDNTNSTTESSEVSSTKNTDEPTSPSLTQSPDLGIPKSYSFPFRRKRLEHWMEIQENQKLNLEITSSLPQWQSMDYSEYDSDIRLRRSLSGSALKSEELDLVDKEKDFSQSVEVSSAVYCSVPTSPSAIDKIKSGFKDVFSKMRRDSFKVNIAKGENKRRAFKSFFQSKENVSLDVFEKKKPKSYASVEYKF